MRMWLFAFIVAATMVNGEKPKSHPSQDKQEPAKAAQLLNDAAGQTVIVINQQTSQGQENNHTAKSPSYLRRLLSPENLPNIALVVVAAITAWYIAQQARETAKATQAMRGGIALQEANFQQWIDINKWKAALGKEYMEVGFDLVNSTDWPLTPLRTYVKIGDTESLRRHDVVLGPKQPYTIDNLFIAVVPEWRGQYISGRAPMLPALIRITYRNCLKKEVQQELTGVIHFAPIGGPVFELMNLPNLRVSEWYKKAKEAGQKAN